MPKLFRCLDEAAVDDAFRAGHVGGAPGREQDYEDGDFLGGRGTAGCEPADAGNHGVAGGVSSDAAFHTRAGT